jgi:hypothetical protein
VSSGRLIRHSSSRRGRGWCRPVFRLEGDVAIFVSLPRTGSKPSEQPRRAHIQDGHEDHTAHANEQASRRRPPRYRAATPIRGSGLLPGCSSSERSTVLVEHRPAERPRPCGGHRSRHRLSRRSHPRHRHRARHRRRNGPCARHRRLRRVVGRAWMGRDDWRRAVRRPVWRRGTGRTPTAELTTSDQHRSAHGWWQPKNDGGMRPRHRQRGGPQCSRPRRRPA